MWSTPPLGHLFLKNSVISEHITGFLPSAKPFCQEKLTSTPNENTFQDSYPFMSQETTLVEKTKFKDEQSSALFKEKNHHDDFGNHQSSLPKIKNIAEKLWG